MQLRSSTSKKAMNSLGSDDESHFLAIKSTFLLRYVYFLDISYLIDYSKYKGKFYQFSLVQSLSRHMPWETKN